MIPHPPPPADPARIAWVPPGCGYAAAVILAAAGTDLSGTEIRETPLLEGVTDILFADTGAALVTSALTRSDPPL